MTTNPLIVRTLPADFRLYRGGHNAPVDGRPLELCFDEAVAWVAGLGHTASPACMCPALAKFSMRLNDRLDDDERQLLIPLLYRCVGTRGSVDLARRRSYLLIDSAIREIAPLGLAAAKWDDLADRLRGIAQIVDTATSRAAYAVCSEVRAEARKRRDAAAAAYDAAAYADAYDAADAADDAYDAAADAADAADAAADAYDAKTSEERARLRSLARRPIIEASIRAFERAISLTEAP